MARKRKKNPLRITGKTEDEKLVVGGWFYSVDTNGTPMAVVIQALDSKGYMPDWCDFYNSALKAGWKPRTIKSKLREAVGEIYSPEFVSEWEKRFKDYTD